MTKANKVNAKEILSEAQASGYALGAFNAVNFETLKAIALAAAKKKAPVIIESSPGETRYIGAKRLRALVDSFIDETGIPIIVNLDHGTKVEDCQLGIDADYDYIHYDGSETNYEENLKNSQIVVAEAHSKGMLVEAEIGFIEMGSTLRTDVSVADAQAKSIKTDPKQAKEFVAASGLDTLAVFIGNLHGKYATAKSNFDFELLQTLRGELDCFFSLHGGSDTVDSEMSKAIKVGRIAKVNINTDLRVAFKSALSGALNESQEIAFYKLAPAAIEAMQTVVEHKIDVFGSAGKAKLI